MTRCPYQVSLHVPQQRLRLTSIAEWLFNGAYLDTLLDNGYLPQPVIRFGIRQQLQQRVNIISKTSLPEAYEEKMKYVTLLRSRPIAIETAKANEQHYEVGTEILRGMLGPRMKYSCCLYPKGSETLGEAEVRMLETYVQKAQLKDGMKILDLGFVFRPITCSIWLVINT